MRECSNLTTYKEVSCNLLFKHHDHFVLVVKGIVKVEEVRVMEIVHDVDFVTNGRFVAGIRRVDEFGYEISARSSFDDTMDDTKSSAVKQSCRNITNITLRYKNPENLKILIKKLVKRMNKDHKTKQNTVELQYNVFSGTVK